MKKQAHVELAILLKNDEFNYMLRGFVNYIVVVVSICYLKLVREEGNTYMYIYELTSTNLIVIARVRTI
jgi:hypothetical protein